MNCTEIRGTGAEDLASEQNEHLYNRDKEDAARGEIINSTEIPRAARQHERNKSCVRNLNFVIKDKTADQ